VIVVDTSAVIAIMRGEPEASTFEEILDGADAAIMSVVSHVEAHMVIAGRRPDADFDRVEEWFLALGIEIVSVTPEQGILAVKAFLEYGKGRHPARLNLSDCFAYALAKHRDLPLLFKGEDFTQTDLAPAWRP
jgi:ribonuclease VapC